MQQLPLEVVMNGLYRATIDAGTQLDAPVHAKLIMCFWRHRHADSDVLRNTPSLPPAAANEAWTIMQQVIDASRSSSAPS